MLHHLEPEEAAACCGESKGSAERMALQTELRARATEEALPAGRRSRSRAKERRRGVLSPGNTRTFWPGSCGEGRHDEGKGRVLA